MKPRCECENGEPITCGECDRPIHGHPWIPVAERLPDDLIEVLISTTHESYPVWIGYIETDEDGRDVWFWNSGKDLPDGVVNAWMPLPEAFDGEAA